MIAGFIPGTHCVSCQISNRLTVLADGQGTGSLRYVCKDCLPKEQAGRRRSAAAMKAVATKRAKYKTWPSRKGDHR